MVPQNIQLQIIAIWDKYIAENKKVLDTRGNEIQDINTRRSECIVVLKGILSRFLSVESEVSEFKTEVDSYNKQNNLWGFTAVKGQMFFNMMLKNCDDENEVIKISSLLRDCIEEPKDISNALNKISALEKYLRIKYQSALDKRKVANPSSVCYFLSYFWQIQNYEKWPVMYSSLIASFSQIGLWEESETQKDNYEKFYVLNDEIKEIFNNYSGKVISNWDVEHAFWNFRTIKSIISKKDAPGKDTKTVEEIIDTTVLTLTEASFDIYDYVPRVVANLVELGSETETSSSAKGSKYEKTVCEAFKQLGFTVQQLGQGTGREPDLIAIHKEENVAFIVDAKAYANGYMMGAADERAIKEYINHYCPKLKKEGIQRIGFIIVSNSFKSNFEEYINDVTWKTDIKRFVLLSTSALLHLLAYRTKDQKTLSEIVETIISLGTTISAQDIVQQFDDI